MAEELVIDDNCLLSLCQTRQEEDVCLVRLDPVHLVNLRVFIPSIVQIKLIESLSIAVLLHHADVLYLQGAVHINEGKEV